MPAELDTTRPLPAPDDPVIHTLFSSKETAAACAFLLSRREDPPTMAEWLDHAEQMFGKSNVHSQRRLREVRDQFVVSSSRPPGGRAPVYRLEGWRTEPAGGKIDSKLQAEVFERMGRYCHMCGATPPQVKLQIDHKVPAAWGGKTVIENLEPLCEDHNRGKQALFASMNTYSEALARALPLGNPWERIGELLKAFHEKGEAVPVKLIELAARDTNKGDPTKRLRELRFVLGWEITARRVKKDGVTAVSYELLSWKPWPAEGAPKAVNRYERERKRRKAAEVHDTD
ncbi:HNH endonuclease [Kitasatospora sp. NPDC093550]|uniref:HNH endonuclease n=1 Tax=Kitasatospora sp. NPDC093550 TaxID=3364089 RepID=UPI0038141FA2